MAYRPEVKLNISLSVPQTVMNPDGIRYAPPSHQMSVSIESKMGEAYNRYGWWQGCFNIKNTQYTQYTHAQFKKVLQEIAQELNFVKAHKTFYGDSFTEIYPKMTETMDTIVDKISRYSGNKWYWEESDVQSSLGKLDTL